MSWLYIAVVWFASLVLADDVGLGNIHPVRGAFIMLALVYNVAYTVYKRERKKKYKKVRE